ncbi:MAG: SpoIIIAH-like family protein [Clostridiales bacterium]|nr:SpoIIIAH-like family protein [Clostridiales bacterium]
MGKAAGHEGHACGSAADLHAGAAGVFSFCAPGNGRHDGGGSTHCRHPFSNFRGRGGEGVHLLCGNGRYIWEGRKKAHGRGDRGPGRRANGSEAAAFACGGNTAGAVCLPGRGICHGGCAMREKMIHFLLMILVGLALGIAVSEKAPPESAMIIAVSPAPTPTPHPVDAYRLHRESVRKEDIQALEMLMNALDTDEKIRALAGEELLRMSARDQVELAVEGALSAYGDGKAICVAGEDSVTVFLSQSLTEQEAALIFELVQEFSLVSPENIRITGC